MVYVNQLTFKGKDAVLFELVPIISNDNFMLCTKFNNTFKVNLGKLSDNVNLVANKISAIKRKAQMSTAKASKTPFHLLKNGVVTCLFDCTSIFALKHQIFFIYSLFNNNFLFKSLSNSTINLTKSKVNLKMLILNVLDTLLPVINEKKINLKLKKVQIIDDIVISYNYLRALVYNTLAFVFQNTKEGEEIEVELELERDHFQSQNTSYYLFSIKIEEDKTSINYKQLAKILNSTNLCKSFESVKSWKELADFKINIVNLLLIFLKEFPFKQGEIKEDKNELTITVKDGFVSIDLSLMLVTADKASASNAILSESTFYNKKMQYEDDITFRVLSTSNTNFYEDLVKKVYLKKLHMDVMYKNDSNNFAPSRQMSSVRRIHNKESIYQHPDALLSSNDERENEILEEDNEMFDILKIELLKLTKSPVKR